MPRVLTVDDSRLVRQMVVRLLTELGIEYEEAENGEDGLRKAQEINFDLIVLDITMPVLDGPGMLAKLRASGRKTPVLMLTSESKRSVITDLIRLGIDDYILKPFTGDELREKLLGALKIAAPPPAAAPVRPEPAPAAAPARPAASAAPAGPAGRPAVDILVIDDMPTVAKKLRTMIPPRIVVDDCVDGHAALATCREKTYRVVIIDTDIPNVHTPGLGKQIRLLQPNAALVALSMRSVDCAAEMRAAGFESILYKPFDAAGVDDLISRHFDNTSLLEVEENVMIPGPLHGNRPERYFSQLATSMSKALDGIGAACLGPAIIDFKNIPPEPDRAARLVIDLRGKAGKIGVELRLVGPRELAQHLKQIEETKAVPFFATVREAQEAA